MALQALITTPIPTTTTTTTSTARSSKADTRAPPPPPSSLPFQNTSLTNGIQRRNLISLGIAGGAVWGLNLGENNAWAAARRPPPPPAVEKEKKDPNINGVLAKVLASKKRKEAMKEAMAQLRKKGNQIKQ